MKNLLFTLFVAAFSGLIFLSADSKPADNQSVAFIQSNKMPPSPLDGAWELYSTESKGKTTFHNKPSQIKVYNDGYFCIMGYDSTGKFSYAAAGTYELDGNHYKETCTYHSSAKYVGWSIWFDWSMKGDTLFFYGFKKVVMPDGTDVTKDWGGDGKIEKKVRVKK